MNCVGGIQVLFPLLEQVNKLPVPKEVLSPEAPIIADICLSITGCSELCWWDPGFVSTIRAGE